MDGRCIIIIIIIIIIIYIIIIYIDATPNQILESSGLQMGS